jgi:hypothetical protein
MKIEWPSIGSGDDCISQNAFDLITKLLELDEKKRLGFNGASEI